MSTITSKLDYKTKEACRLLDAFTTAFALPGIYSREAKDMAIVELEYMLTIEDEESCEFIRQYIALLRKE